MHEPYCGDPSITEFDVHYMEDPANAKRTRLHSLGRDPDLPRKQFLWGQIPKNVDPTKVLKLCLEHDDKSVVTIPEVIRHLPNLLWLEIPSRFVPQLEAKAIPPTTRTLRITGDGKTALPKGLCLPGLERLERLNNIVLKFHADQVPNVRHLGVQLDPGSSILRELKLMEKLTALEVGPISNRGILEELAKLPLRFFKPIGGNLDSLGPIRGCPTLTNIWLVALSKLTSLAPLADLPDLRELSVSYCGRLSLDPSILRMPAIRKLFFFACNDIGLTAIRPQLEAMNMEYFFSSGTR